MKFRNKTQALESFGRYVKSKRLWNPLPVLWSDFRFVWAYVENSDDQGVLFYLRQNDIQGYSLYIHEFTELKWFFDDYRHMPSYAYTRSENETDEVDYTQAHSLALIAEHQYLQKIARSEGKDFSLRELILCNPGAETPASDWKIVYQYRFPEISVSDLIRRTDLAEVRDWYNSKGFQPQIPLGPVQ